VFDGQAGLHQNGYREYDPATGRYVESNLIGLKGGLNTYAYVQSNPIMFMDLWGLKCTYVQSTGNFTCNDDITGQVYAQCTGYSGRLTGLNSPNAESIGFYGPLPQGLYIIGYPTHAKGPLSFPLLPAPFTNMLNRPTLSFLIHGDNDRHDHSASGREALECASGDLVRQSVLT
jgi:RHS repeat-associated protein